MIIELNFGKRIVLQEPYTFKKACVVIQEMAEGMALDLVSKRLVTDQLVLTVGYDAECLTRPEIREKYHGEITTNYYGKAVPKHAHGTFSPKNQQGTGKDLARCRQGLPKELASSSKLFELAYSLRSTWEGLWKYGFS